jgi:hypothetical protein
MKDTKPWDFAGIENGLKSLLNAQLQLGTELINLAGGTQGIFDIWKNFKIPKIESCCEVPEPCWMPLSLGEVRCALQPGDSGTVCLVVTNGDFRAHAYEFAATGRSSAAVSFSTASATLGPKERIAVTATFKMPEGSLEDDCRCIGNEALIWVRGCRDHYLRWMVSEASSVTSCCREIEVDDDPDYVLHWYDHFYLPRPCFGTLATSTKAGNTARGVIP